MRSAEIGPKTGPKNRRRAASATPPDASKPASELGSRSGASRTRTGDLLGAIQAVITLEFRLFAGPLRPDGLGCESWNYAEFTGFLRSSITRMGPRDEIPPACVPAQAVLGNECLPHRCSRPSVRAVNRWNLLRVQPLGDLLQRHPLPEQRVDLLSPCVVTAVAEPMRKPDVVRGEVTSVHLQSRIVVGGRLPIGTPRSRVEVATTPEAVALGHLATHVD
jgi:hypothetical protein